MNQHDKEFLEKQLRTINSAPRRDRVIILTVLMTFFAGVVLGLLTGSSHELTRLAANEVASAIPYPGGTPLTMR